METIHIWHCGIFRNNHLPSVWYLGISNSISFGSLLARAAAVKNLHHRFGKNFCIDPCKRTINGILRWKNKLNLMKTWRTDFKEFKNFKDFRTWRNIWKIYRRRKGKEHINMVWGGRKIHNIFFKFREEESSLKTNSKTH